MGMNYIFINKKGYDIETSCCKAISSIDEYGDRYCKIKYSLLHVPKSYTRINVESVHEILH